MKKENPQPETSVACLEDLAAVVNNLAAEAAVLAARLALAEAKVAKANAAYRVAEEKVGGKCPCCGFYC